MENRDKTSECYLSYLVKIDDILNIAALISSLIIIFLILISKGLRTSFNILIIQYFICSIFLCTLKRLPWLSYKMWPIQYTDSTEPALEVSFNLCLYLFVTFASFKWYLLKFCIFSYKPTLDSINYICITINYICISVIYGIGYVTYILVCFFEVISETVVELFLACGFLLCIILMCILTLNNLKEISTLTKDEPHYVIKICFVICLCYTSKYDLEYCNYNMISKIIMSASPILIVYLLCRFDQKFKNAIFCTKSVPDKLNTIPDTEVHM